MSHKLEELVDAFVSRLPALPPVLPGRVQRDFCGYWEAHSLAAALPAQLLLGLRIVYFLESRQDIAATFSSGVS